jgi:SAM-dependent methyltransferase
MSHEPYLYPGAELELFAHARNWKRYWISKLPALKGDVLEVGAGLATNTAMMLGPQVRTWWCMEPDAAMLEGLSTRLAADPTLDRCRALPGTLATIDPGHRFDAIVYIDVLEHTADDRGELARAAAHLRQDGLLVVLAPAHNWLYTDFDRAIGHYRRYSKATLAALAPPALTCRQSFYLDSAGLLGSAANRLLLRTSMPGLAQIRFWDRVLVPLSRALDPLTSFSIGKSVVAVWQR